MKAALVVHRVTFDQSSNLERIKTAIGEAADRGSDLVLFSEASLTGLVNNDDPSHDLPLGQTIPGPATDLLGDLCRRKNIWLAIGLLEHDEERLYDSAVLIDPKGEIITKYRRNSEGWHGEKANPSVYRQGEEIYKAETQFGSVAFLICGDLFDDSIVARLHDIEPDWLLFPFARCFDNSLDKVQEFWDKEEKELYLERVRLTGVTTLMVNYIADRDIEGGAFGGAMVVRPDGFVMDSLPLEKSGTLYIEI